MAQVVIYGLKPTFDAHRAALSGAIHSAIMKALDYPVEKRFHRFIALDPADFIYPEDRGPHYTIIEISMFEGRTASAKRALISELFARIESATGIAPHSVEITITETPRIHWGIRGQNAQDLSLGYQVDV
ncbi:tautomerase family protein [Curtobacterium pusillum]|uniref:Tautomerase family protein n=1 Tax=Curtobacterium pusillum TaxID=69373 RepID=A0ABX2M542_9MICO|nr:tautomerase family protein [Curtobacterium pusillum]NUU13230.1 tautomerase family protein [Curtobacterium pusillum]GLK31829.1 tautomerase [Curtobacterium pusillum]